MGAESITLARGASQVVRRWGVVVGIGTAIAAFSILQIYVARVAIGEHPSLWVIARFEYPIWVFWMGATVPVVMLARRVPVDGQRRGASTLIHLIAAICLSTLFVGFRMLWYQSFNPYPLAGASVSVWFWRIFRDSFLDGFVIYWAILGVYHAFANLARVRQRELEATAIRARLAEAKLQALRMQLRPHFLFNSLNTAAAVLSQDPRTARRVLGRLGDLLRASLQADARDEVSLAQEISLLEGFLEIERARFGSRLTVALEIAPETRTCTVPSFLLQPLVENAVRHGFAARGGRGALTIRSAARGAMLELEVTDDGPGLGGEPLREGIGLRNTRERLQELYGPRHGFVIADRPGGGVAVRLRIPLRRRAEPDTEARLA